MCNGTTLHLTMSQGSWVCARIVYRSSPPTLVVKGVGPAVESSQRIALAANNGAQDVPFVLKGSVGTELRPCPLAEVYNCGSGHILIRAHRAQFALRREP